MTKNDDSDEEIYSYKSSKTVYKRTRSRPTSAVPVYTSTDADKEIISDYLPVSKWAVDYNNKNYIRSMCNKNKGLHRKLKGRPPQFKIHYDNNYFTRSKVNAPKGLHRKVPEIKRKYVPDDDELADASGWEFDYGPEFDQLEQDAHYIPEGRIVRRGCYRWYGVKRNDSDYDLKLDEDERENLLTEELEKELKYGQEFLQSDIPYMEEQKNRRYSRGGYRFYETLRNVHDFKPEEFDEKTPDPEWRRKYHCNGVRYLDREMCDCENEDVPEHSQHVRKGKPFHRTILNKVYQLKREDSSKDVKRHATRLSLIPGESGQSLYEGIPDRIRYGTEKSPSIRSAYKKEVEKFRRTKGEEYEEYEKEDTEKSYTELRSEYRGNLHKTTDIRQGRRLSDEELIRKEKGNRRFDEHSYRTKPETDIRHGRRLSDEELIRKEKGNRRFDEHSYRIKPEDEVRRKRKYSRNGSDTDVRENIETWKEKTLYREDEDEDGQHIFRKKSSERRKEKVYEDREYTSKNHTAERRRDKKKFYENEEYRSERQVSSSRSGRRHENKIFEQTDVRKVKGSTKDLDDIGSHLQHISTRGKVIKHADDETKFIQNREPISKKMPHYVDERIKHVREKIERKIGQEGRKDKEKDLRIRKLPVLVDERNRNIRDKMGGRKERQNFKDKEQALKKMPPHVEERIRDIRERMERKMEFADRKQKNQRDGGAFQDSSSDECIDLMKHKGHPNDRGETHASEYEKYVTKNGSEIWVKKNEKYAELHHKKQR